MLVWQDSGIRADALLLETLYTYSVSGSVAVIREWVRGGMPLPPDMIADKLEQLTYCGLNAFVK